MSDEDDKVVKFPKSTDYFSEMSREKLDEVTPAEVLDRIVKINKDAPFRDFVGVGVTGDGRLQITATQEDLDKVIGSLFRAARLLSQVAEESSK